LETASKIKVGFFLSFSPRLLLSYKKALFVYLNVDELLSKESKQTEKKIVPRSVCRVRASLPLHRFFFPLQTAINLHDLSPCPLPLLEASEQKFKYSTQRERKNPEIIPICTPPPIYSLPSPCSHASAKMLQHMQGFYLMPD